MFSQGQRMSPSARIPGSREVLWILRLLCVHPVTWNKDRFVVSGLWLVGLHCVPAYYCLRYAIDPFVDSKLPSQLLEASSSSIRSDMDSLIALLSAVAYFAFFLHIVTFFRYRSQIASVFNDLNSIWVA